MHLPFSFCTLEARPLCPLGWLTLRWIYHGQSDFIAFRGIFQYILRYHLEHYLHFLSSWRDLILNYKHTKDSTGYCLRIHLSAFWEHQICKLKKATNSLMLLPSKWVSSVTALTNGIYWKFCYASFCSRPLETGSFHFMFLGRLSLGSQSPCCKKAKAASWRGLVWLSS